MVFLRFFFTREDILKPETKIYSSNKLTWENKTGRNSISRHRHPFLNTHCHLGKSDDTVLAQKSNILTSKLTKFSKILKHFISKQPLMNIIRVS